MNTIDSRPANRLECKWCGSTSDLYMTRFLVIDDVMCENCLMLRTDEELGIEEWENETTK